MILYVYLNQWVLEKVDLIYYSCTFCWIYIFCLTGYALDPTIGGEQDKTSDYIGAKEAAEEADGKTVFESTKERPSDKRKRTKNDNPSDVEGFLGPWGGFVDEKRVMKPNEVSCNTKILT